MFLEVLCYLNHFKWPVVLYFIYGNFVSVDVEFECPILKVVQNKANKDFNEMGVIVKGTIVEVDSKPFKTW